MTETGLMKIDPRTSKSLDGSESPVAVSFWYEKTESIKLTVSSSNLQEPSDISLKLFNFWLRFGTIGVIIGVILTVYGI